MIREAIKLIRTDPDNWCWGTQYQTEFKYVTGISFHFEYRTWATPSLNFITFSLFPNRVLGWFDSWRVNKAIKWWVGYQVMQEVKAAEKRLADEFNARVEAALREEFERALHTTDAHILAPRNGQGEDR